jgi:membrane protein required for colicin V production
MEQGSVNWADLAVAGVVLISAVFAFYRGFVREVLAIAGWVGAAAVAVYYFADARPYVEPYVPGELLADVATGAGLFLVSLVVFWLVIHLVVMRVKDSPLNALDRSLGFLFGVARGVIVIVLSYMVAEEAVWDDEDNPHPEWLTEARSLPLIEKTAVLIKSLIPEDMLNQFGAGVDEAQEAREPSDSRAGEGAAQSEVERMSRPPVAEAEAEGGEATYSDAERQGLDRLSEGVQDGDAEGADERVGDEQ